MSYEENNNMTAAGWPRYEEPSSTDEANIPSVWYS